MSAFDYGRSVETADRLIARFGQEGVLRRPGTATGPAYNPTIGAPVDHDATFVVMSFTNAEIDGTRVLATDKKILLAKGALTITPALSDKLVIAGKEHAILNSTPLAPAGIVVLYEIQARA